MESSRARADGVEQQGSSSGQRLKQEMQVQLGRQVMEWTNWASSKGVPVNQLQVAGGVGCRHSMAVDMVHVPGWWL
jgi:hypothetical protein